MLRLKNIFVILLLTSTMMFFTACGSEIVSGPTFVESVSLNVVEVDVSEEGTYNFSTVILPETATNKGIIYASMSPEIASIDADTGLVTPIAIGSATITVRSVDGSAKYDYATVNVIAIPVTLETPTSFVVQDGYINWAAVANVSSYSVQINGVDTAVVSSSRYEIETFDTTLSIKVKAVGNQIKYFDSEYSEAVITEIYSVPSNFVSDEGVLTWDSAENVSLYQIIVNETIYEQASNTYTLDLNSGLIYTVKVRALSEEENIEHSEFTEELTVGKLSVPVNISYEGFGLVWDSVPEADGYSLEITYDSVVTNVETELNNYQLISSMTAGEYEFRVKAVGDGASTIDSEYSISKTAEKLEVPTNLRAQDGVIRWDVIAGASDYILIINSEAIQVSGNSYILPSLYNAGEYNVGIIANGDDNSYINSNMSDYIYLTKLATVASYGVSSGEIIWTTVANADTYLVNLDGEDNDYEFETANNYLAVGDSVEPGVYYITIQTLGTGKIGSEITMSFETEKLDKPSNISIANGEISWTIVDNSSSYQLNLNGIYVNTGTLANYKVSEAFENSTSYDIMVRSIGDNNKYLSSAFTSTVTGTKLANMADIELQKGLISIESIANASGYVLEINGIEYDFEEENFPYYYEGVAGETYNIRAYAKGSDTYLSSDFTSMISGTKLADIVNLSIEAGSISWDDNVDVTEYQIYIKNILNDDYLAEDIVTTGKITTYDLSQLEAGNYMVKVIGMGDNYSKISTNFTEEIAFGNLSVPANLSVNNGMFVWDEISNADYYIIKVDGVDVIVNDGSTSFVLGETYATGEHTATVRAVGDGTTFIVSEESDTITANKISSVTNVVVVDGVLQWDEHVEATGGYYVVVDGVYYYNLTNQFTAESSFDPGTYSVKVYAQETDGLMSNGSTAITIEKLSTPINLEIENGIVKWISVLTSTGYTLNINGTEIEINDETTASYDLSTFVNYEAGAFVVTIRANGDSIDIINSNWSGSVDTNVMASPENLRVEGGLITWQIVTGATDYELLIYREIAVDTYELLTIDQPLLAGNVTSYLLGDAYVADNYRVKVKAIGNGDSYIDSEYSETFDVTKLPAPTNLGLLSGLIVYDSVVSATGYDVIVDDSYISNLTELSFELDETFEAGDYVVAVRAIGDNTTYLTSNACSTINATKLTTIVNFRVEDGILKWSLKDNVTNYILNINGSEVIVSSLSYELGNSYVGDVDYLIKIKAQGTSSSYLNSDYTEEVIYNKPASISGLTVTNGVINWNQTISASNGFTVYINDGEEEITEIIEDGTETEYILDDSFATGEYTFDIMINGDDVDKLNSIKESITVTKLATPQTITLSESEGEYSLSWDSIANATEYVLTITDKNTDIVYVQYTLTETTKVITNILSIGQYEAIVQAIGDDNEVGYINSDISDILDLTQPSIPTNLAVSNGAVTWSESTNATGYKLTLVYTDPITLIDEEIIENVEDGTIFYLEKLGHYVITISAYYEDSLTSDTTASIETTFDLFESGEGTSVTPFEIVDETQLQNMRYNPTAYYYLSNSITCVNSDFVPVGTLANPFVGSFDADNGVGGVYSINNLAISLSYDYAGLFGYVGSTGIINNVMFNNVNISSTSYYTGAVAGYNTGTITNVVVSGSILPVLGDPLEAIYAGGIAGYNTGVMSQVFNDATVAPLNSTYATYAGGITGYNNGLIEMSGSDSNSNVTGTYAGGIAGYNNGDIEECYNKGTVTATSVKVGVFNASGYAGGITGFNYDTDTSYSGTITNCYNTGAVTATSNNVNAPYAGGIAGRNVEDSITYCYNTGLISATSSYSSTVYAAAIVGYNSGLAGNVQKCYYYSGSASVGVGGTTAGVDCVSMSEAEMQQTSFVQTTLTENNDPDAEEISLGITAYWIYVSGDYPALHFE